ncbi:hypothetical protein TIFTF001_053740 [Ficus carica]|uniref:Gnk2-homologous domain-containing protein n=1 Tax=Ficus carica TaxID=3494 RepID=A0AA88EGM2_FICCA|nr:hypothetical protein TIFTF001_018941 [Ficus carica]GMN73753.1 hypothetical protein TIFTF001_053740 [Ficus carica]
MWTNFCGDLGTVLDVLIGQAAPGGSLRKFATGSARLKNSETLHALVQCTPDLSQLDCTNCLDNALAKMVQLAVKPLASSPPPPVLAPPYQLTIPQVHEEKRVIH